jgi:phosphatidylinositol N-acetylglucosaminyltransferase subunit H
MLTITPHLRIRRPSPTTVEFTVSTSPPPPLPLRVLYILLGLTRITLAVSTILLLRAVCITTLPKQIHTHILFPKVFAHLDASPIGTWLFHLSTTLPPSTITVPLSLLLLYALSLRSGKSESLLVMRGLGVQTTETPGSYLRATATRFIPTEKIRDVFVNEAFRGFEVRYYLVVVVEGEEEVVVVFPGLLPGRKIVETVWRGVRECLYERTGEEKGS